MTGWLDDDRCDGCGRYTGCRCGDPIASIREHVEELSVSHAWWSARDIDRRDGGKSRRAASSAIDSIDALLRELHQLRAQTITECRRWDDAVDARVDAYLAVRRQQ